MLKERYYIHHFVIYIFKMVQIQVITIRKLSSKTFIFIHNNINTAIAISN